MRIELELTTQNKMDNTKNINRFLVIEGQFRTGNAIYKKGDTIETHVALDELFANKFQRLSEVVFRDELSPNRQMKRDTKMLFVFADATEVTHQYPMAQDNNLRVFKDTTGSFAVAVAGIPDEDMMNIAPTIMGSKKQVNEWLGGYLQEHVQS